MTGREYKQKLLNELYAPYEKCLMCPLGQLGRTNVVFGEGNPDAQLMLIGEGPGRDEDIQGRPFVGRSGKLLTATLNELDIQRADIFIANIVKCRPPNNRPPTPLESTTCKSLFLYNQIKIIRPKVICTLGSTALTNLLGTDLLGPDFKISKVRGTKQHWEGIIVIPTYHPAYILRNGTELKTFVEDLMLAIAETKT